METVEGIDDRVALLAQALDSRIGRVEVFRDHCRLHTADRVLLGDLGGLTLPVLAALGHDDVRGIRRGLRNLLIALERVPRGVVDIHTRGTSVTMSLRTDTHEEQFELTRDPAMVSGPYDYNEFGTVSKSRITVKAPGRALAPLPASIFQERAGALLAALREGTVEDLFALPPLMVVLGLTDRCNHRCPFCFRQRDPSYAVSDGGVFTDANLTSLLLDLSETGVRALRLCGEGEDTLHPNYEKYLLIARASGMSVLQITNGSTLRRLAPLVARCVAFLRVSINGWNSRQYDRCHGVVGRVSFDNVIAGVQAVASEPGRTTAVCVSTVITDETYASEEFAALMTATRADVAVLKQDRECSRATDGDLIRLQVHGGRDAAIVARQPPSRDRFDQIAARCRATYPSVFREHDPGMRTENPTDWITALGLGCVLRYLRVEIERLEMYNCSLLHQYYGDLRARSVSDAWVSKERRAGVVLDAKRSPVLCGSCGWGDLFSVMNHFFEDDVLSRGHPPALHIPT